MNARHIRIVTPVFISTVFAVTMFLGADDRVLAQNVPKKIVIDSPRNTAVLNLKEFPMLTGRAFGNYQNGDVKIRILSGWNYYWLKKERRWWRPGALDSTPGLASRSLRRFREALVIIRR